MATVYTQYDAIERATDRALRDNDTYTVWKHCKNKNDFIVKNAAAAHPRNFIRLCNIGPNGTEVFFPLENGDLSGH